MDAIFGLVGDGFTILVADTTAARSIVTLKTEEDKIMVLDQHKLLGNTGESGDRVQFSEYIQKNIHLYEYRNGIRLTTDAAANYTRGELAKALRSSPYQTNCLIAGWDKDVGPSLYYLDYISTLHKVNFTAMGYGGNFILSLLDKWYVKDISLEAALDIVDKCIEQIRLRLIVAPANFIIKIVDKDGARVLGWRRTVNEDGSRAEANAPAVPAPAAIDGPRAVAAQ